MATKIINLNLEEPLCVPDDITAYEHVLFVVRLYQRPVGLLTLPVHNGRVLLTDLQRSLRQHETWSYWQQQLHYYLDWEEVVSESLPTATVAVCTRDRPDDLARCLVALMALHDDGQEILIIDNAPATDATQKIVAQYQDKVRYVREDRPGLDVARNRAIREARHEIIVFNDDDAVPEPNWLRALLRNYADPQVACVTGLTLPIELETEAQERFERHSPFNRGFGRKVFDLNVIHPLSAHHAGAGVNMSLRLSAIQEIGGFDEALDAGTPTQSGGDTEMLSRIVAHGFRIVYDPAAVSWHRHRRTWEALLKIMYSYGRGSYAYWTRRLVLDKEYAVLLYMLGWWWYDQLPDLVNGLLRRPGHIPLEMTWQQLRGCLSGPWAYWQSYRQQKQWKEYDN